MTSTIKVNTITTESGSTLTVGGCGKTVALASGASQTGFGREGSVNWQTGSLKTTTFTAVSGEGYFINQGSAITMNLPAGSAGAIVAVSDYARNFATYNLTISPNGSEKIGGVAEDLTLNVNGQALTLVYVDSTKGWINVQNAEDTETGSAFISASGGTETTVNCGVCKVHTFTGPGNFVVSSISSCVANNIISYTIIGGGGGGGDNDGGGGGGGGYREVKNPISPYTASPLDGYPVIPNRVTVTAASFPIVIGGGGTLGPAGTPGTNGSNSSGFSITSAGGGGGASECGTRNGLSGGSGGGGGAGGGTQGSGGAGNTPPVSPAQGNAGGNAAVGPSPSSQRNGGGGGGATAVGEVAQAASRGGGGGAGATSSINGTPTGRAGGGGGGGRQGLGPASNGGGSGGDPGTSAVEGTTNTGGGGGGAAEGGPGDAKNGGSGIVIIRYKVA
jgi:hypothetical protein